MSDYVPPENPYDAPQEQGAASRRSPWVVVIVVLAVALVLGACFCGMAGVFVFYSRVEMQPVQEIIQPQPVPAVESGDVQPAQELIEPVPVEENG